MTFFDYLIKATGAVWTLIKLALVLFILFWLMGFVGDDGFTLSNINWVVTGVVLGFIGIAALAAWIQSMRDAQEEEEENAVPNYDQMGLTEEQKEEIREINRKLYGK